MILVLPYCRKDAELALSNLLWIEELDPKLPYHVILSHDNDTPATAIRDMNIVANRVFSKVEVMWYPAPLKKHWPAAANWAFQNAARYVAHFHKGESWLFLEADAVPIKSGWLQQLEAGHRAGGRPFSGHIVDGMGHMNGVGIYPSDVAAYSQDAMLAEETAWDVVLGAKIDKDKLIHPLNEIIRHCWNIGADGEPTNGHGTPITFKSVHDVVRYVDLKASIFHRCKDGSLIKWLREHYKAPHKAMVPDHTSYEEKIHIGGDGTILSAPETTAQRNSQEDKIGNLESDVGQKVSGAPEPDGVTGSGESTVRLHEQSPKTEILIVTYFKDFPWLEWSLKCLRKHAKGFAGITLMIPNKDLPTYNDSISAESKGACRVVGYDEVEGKGMVQHMAVMGMADEFVPKGIEFILHMDADCMFKEAVTPADYIEDGKPVYVIRSYKSLTDTTKAKVVSDCIQWKEPTERALKMPVEMYTMCRHPTVFPISFYKRLRNFIKSKQGVPFQQYMLSGRNEFPQTVVDFPMFGAFCYAHMRDRFKWVDVSGGNHLAPKDKMVAFWSHGGLTPEIQKQIEGFLA